MTKLEKARKVDGYQFKNKFVTKYQVLLDVLCLTMITENFMQ